MGRGHVFVWVVETSKMASSDPHRGLVVFRFSLAPLWVVEHKRTTRMFDLQIIIHLGEVSVDQQANSEE